MSYAGDRTPSHDSICSVTEVAAEPGVVLIAVNLNSNNLDSLVETLANERVIEATDQLFSHTLNLLIGQDF
jgi:hypothetical protein